jgi:tetrahydromethanopterin S-methyltransferase subunit G
MEVLVHSPVFHKVEQEDVPADNSEIMKRIQSLHGKVEGLKNEIGQLKVRLNVLEDKPVYTKAETVNAVGQTLITEKK